MGPLPMPVTPVILRAFYSGADQESPEVHLA
jgi:hypothetical protein